MVQFGRSVVVKDNNDYQRGDSIGNATITVATKITPRPSGVIRPRYLQPKQYVEDNDGFHGYNSTYDLGIVNYGLLHRTCTDQ